MNRIAPAFLACAIALVAILVYRAARVPHNPPASPPSPEEASSGATLVLPVSSDLWTNAGRSQHSAAANVAKSPVIPGIPANPPTTVSSDPVNPEALQARTKELLAHAALESVGLDPDADQYWLAAISDQTISPEERRNLILGLNEVGLPDPKQIAPEDLPLIASRIALLEEVAPHAVDRSDEAAFQDTYRNLLSMFASASATVTATQESAQPEAEAE